MLVHLLRHGQSTWNLEGRLQGQTMDVPLTDRGRAQAEAAARALSGHQLDAVYSSDQARALDTARIVAEPHGLVVTTTPLLREQSLGELEGRLHCELVAQPVPEGSHLSEIAWGGGESLQQVHRRVTRLVDDLGTCHGAEDELVLVSHGDTLRVLLAVLDQRSHREVEWITIDNGAVLTRMLHRVAPP